MHLGWCQETLATSLWQSRAWWTPATLPQMWMPIRWPRRSFLTVCSQCFRFNHGNSTLVSTQLGSGVRKKMPTTRWFVFLFFLLSFSSNVELFSCLEVLQWWICPSLRLWRRAKKKGAGWWHKSRYYPWLISIQSCDKSYSQPPTSVLGRCLQLQYSMAGLNVEVKLWVGKKHYWSSSISTKFHFGRMLSL